MEMRDWISLREVSLIRGQRLILDNISWEVAPSDHWIVLGANGSGKTTLLQVLAGYLWPTRGRITVLGKPFGRVDLRELRKEIGWVGSFLQTQVPPSQRPLDLIVSGKFASIGLYGTPEEEDYRQAEVLAVQLGCGEILDLPYGVLSQGEKQRLLIARALIHNPRLLILDEPCAGLDMIARERITRLLDTLGRSSRAPTMIYVTHHLEEIVPAFSHVILLKGGHCLAQGIKNDILRSEVLSEAFHIPLRVHSRAGRYWASFYEENEAPSIEHANP